LIFIEVIVVAALIGALLELDEYYVGITLVSQPIIAGGLAGFFCGDIKTGIVIGGIVQLIWLMPPVGAYVPPSPSAIAFSSTFMGVVMAASRPQDERHALLMFALIIGACFGYFTGQMDVWNRQLNTRIMRLFEKKIEEGKASCAYFVQALAISAKYVRDAAGYMLIFYFGIPFALKIYDTMPFQVVNGLKLAFWAVPMIGFAVLYDMYRTKTGVIFHVITLVVAYVVMSLHRVNMYYLMGILFIAGLWVIYAMVWRKKAVKNAKE